MTSLILHGLIILKQDSNSGRLTPSLMPFCQVTGILLENHGLDGELPWRCDPCFFPGSFPAVLMDNCGLRDEQSLYLCACMTPTVQQGLNTVQWGRGDSKLYQLHSKPPICPLSLRSDAKWVLVGMYLFKKITGQSHPWYNIIIKYNLLCG